MGKVADVRLFWKRSVSPDATKVKLRLNVNGQETVTELGKDVESFQLVVQSSSVVSFSVETMDSDGQVATSTLYTFSTGDLESPLPATDLGHEILGIREEANGVITP